MTNKNEQIIIGTGTTGLSCIRYLSSLGYPLLVVDSRLDAPNQALLKQNYPSLECVYGQIPAERLKAADRIIVSPGFDLSQLPLTTHELQNISIVNDIELFCQAAVAPYILITGTNGKSTVTQLVYEMILEAKISAAVGGNIGIPALDLLQDNTPQYYVLEISSFQLELMVSQRAIAACILNISPDHLDRHHTLENYVQIKKKIYQGCEQAVFNAEDSFTHPPHALSNAVAFTLQTPKANEWGIVKENDQHYLAYGREKLINTAELTLHGQHNWANALAACALGDTIGLSWEAMKNTLKKFKGLAHRLVLVRTWEGVGWYNDSKGTNVGATKAAIAGLAPTISGQIILIAGGQGKGADFSYLRDVVKEYVRTVVVIGEDAALIHEALNPVVPVIFADNLALAVNKAREIAYTKDAVLLSPACASWDMFQDYRDRGNQFTQLVQGLK